MDYQKPLIEKPITKKYRYPKKPTVVVGFGPAGMFCALYLARQGFNPLIIERGKKVDERKNSVQFFSVAKRTKLLTYCMKIFLFICVNLR